MKKLFLVTLVAASFAIVGCGGREKSADQIQNSKQEMSLRDGVNAVGLPAIVNWKEKRTLKMIYELRDQAELRTYTYMVNANGDLRLLCDSLGYPINDATGYTNPENKVEHSAQGYLVLPQAEPNGLFTPDFSNSYWVMCLNKEAGKPSPVFMAGSPVVSTFPLN